MCSVLLIINTLVPIQILPNIGRLEYLLNLKKFIPDFRKYNLVASLITTYFPGEHKQNLRGSYCPLPLSIPELNTAVVCFCNWRLKLIALKRCHLVFSYHISVDFIFNHVPYRY